MAIASNRRRPITSVALASLALAGLTALAACGDDDSGGSSAATTTASATTATGATTTASGGGGGKLTFQTVDFAYDPTTASAKAGTVDADVTNAGAITHNFSIDALKVDQDLDVGKTVTVALGDVKAGTYEYYCKYHAGSMKGTLTVG